MHEILVIENDFRQLLYTTYRLTLGSHHCVIVVIQLTRIETNFIKQTRYT